MPTINPLWTEAAALAAFDDTSPADGVTSTVDLDIDTVGPYELVNIQLKWTENGAASGTSTISIYSSSDSGTTDDTVPIYSQSVTSTAAAQVITIQISRLPYIRIDFTNDTGQETTALSGKYSGLQYTSA